MPDVGAWELAGLYHLWNDGGYRFSVYGGMDTGEKYGCTTVTLPARLIPADDCVKSLLLKFRFSGFRHPCFSRGGRLASRCLVPHS